ncbi:MAG: Gfo/Idh/MocA family oxidoreductase [Actinobacteria bacterium]|nr:Gfo/Idh/MocA family oxidoreductase [Actinomycetota bacterium]
MNKIGFGIIGCGGIALDAHIPSIDAIKEAELVAISRRSEDKAKEIADRCNVGCYYTDNQKVIDHPDVDAVIVTTPPNSHAEWTIKAARAGKHVLCEKPMAISIKECDEMISACKKANVVLMIAEMKRFNPGFRMAKKLIDDGVIGELFMARYHNSYHEPHTRKSWWVIPEISGGGEMMNELTHQVNVLRWMMGDVTQVSCMSNNPQGPPPEDNSAVTLRFKNDALAVVTISWMTKEYNLRFPAPMEHAWDERIDIFGKDGAIIIQTPFTYWRVPLELCVYTERDIQGFNRGWNLVRCPATAHYIEQVSHFIRCTRKEEKCEVSGEEGRADLAVVRAAMESAESGRVVSPSV